ncbi:MAG: tetratricopeptide repeat protein, partial [Deltaproteobacteria bacterium]|nr:tetratricopeptide repeat protein [Deltaproteobacteria bacterium]
TSTLFLGYAYLANAQYQEAISVSEEVMRFSEKYGFELCGTFALAFRGYALAATGDLDGGVKLVGRAEKSYLETGARYFYAGIQLFYGQLSLQITEGGGPKSFSFMVKNIRSLIKLVPGAARKGEEHFNKAIEIFGEIGAKGSLAQAHLGLGSLYRAKGRKEKARESLLKAIEIFEEIQADVFLKQAKEALASLG